MLTNLRPNTVGVRDDLYQVRLVVFSVGKETTSFHKIFLLGQALDLLVLVSWTHYCAYTSNLSTSLSLRDLTSEEWEILS